MKHPLTLLVHSLFLLCLAWGCSNPKNGDLGAGETDNGPQCSGNQVVAGNACVCREGTTTCGTQCVDTRSDGNNCGGCNLQCSPGQVCSAGFCGNTCAPGTVQCGQSCVNLLTDGVNCGGCGVVCSGGTTCNSGACSCPPGATCGNTGSSGASGVGGATGTSGGGGAPPGGSGSGSGGSAGLGASGSGSGASGAAGTGTTGGTPAGYWTSKNWHGCSWTGKDNLGSTTITPIDFTSKPAADPWCISGTVGADPVNFATVALLGFNVNETTNTCAFNPASIGAVGPPTVTPTDTGIAVNFVKRGNNTSFTLRLQIQGPNASMPDPVGAMDRWCATITEVQGKIFVPYSSFTPSCWELTPALRGTPFNPAVNKLDAVVFTVPGGVAAVPFDFCVNGVAYGTSAADAPDGPAVAGTQMGTVGSASNLSDAPSYPSDFARAKINVGGKDYIIQNNNWGNPAGTFLQLTYLDNSFKITAGSGSGSTSGPPASFPSIYIGNNGNTQNGVFSTSGSDHLPKQISAITSAVSTFRYSGSTGLFNATYDIWFAASPPTAQYNDGISGFVMVWLRDPTGAQPIGTQMASNVMVAGQPWNVWVGPRGPGPMGSQSNAPVVSFVNPSENNDSRSQSFVNVDLKQFMTAAAAYGISSNLYLTDVFAGFEIWNGGSGGNLGVDEYKTIVSP